ncbi:hypothetical protein RIF29_27391 [Crotalaria pallida]|uniref:Uncharacterized protein n=1 Tax=Crotalaria pallida TaxID=3830 RepID=A0AAN9EPH4_CROPI
MHSIATVAFTTLPHRMLSIMHRRSLSLPHRAPTTIFPPNPNPALRTFDTSLHKAESKYSVEQVGVTVRPLKRYMSLVQNVVRHSVHIRRGKCLPVAKDLKMDKLLCGLNSINVKTYPTLTLSILTQPSSEEGVCVCDADGAIYNGPCNFPIPNIPKNSENDLNLISSSPLFPPSSSLTPNSPLPTIFHSHLLYKLQLLSSIF